MFESDAFRNRWAPRLLSIVRIIVGLLYLQYGLSKYFGFPSAQPQGFAMMSLIGLAGAIEIVGSLCFALGVYTRWAAFIMSGEMAVAYLIARHRWTVSFFPTVNGGQLEALLCFFFTFFLVGGGAWTLDRLWRGKQDPAIATEALS
jgi:putative oxidoreductase